MDETPEFLDTRQAASLLGIEPVTLRQHARNHVRWLPEPLKLGGRYVWRASDLDGVKPDGPGPKAKTEFKTPPPPVQP